MQNTWHKIKKTNSILTNSLLTFIPQKHRDNFKDFQYNKLVEYPKDY